MFSRRNALRVLIAIFVPEDAQVDVATLDFGEVKLIGALITGRQFLKKENLGHESP